ncbi:MAG: hydroxymethylglutaryl-CoA reductase (NADPH), partial [Saprospiraceae bacterium]
MIVPSLILKQLYTFGSLTNVEGGVAFGIKNRLSDAKIQRITSLAIGGQTIDLDDIILDLGTEQIHPTDISADNPVDFPLKQKVTIIAKIPNLPEGKYKIELGFKANPFGKLKLKVEGSIVRKRKNEIIIPRDSEDDYSEKAIKDRQDFLEEYTGKKLEHVKKYSFDPHIAAGNCEHFTGVAQIPIGIAGPIKINGEHAKGEF